MHFFKVILKCCIVLSFLEGYAQSNRGFTPKSFENQLEAEQIILDHSIAVSFKNHLIHLCSAPHVAGTPQNEKIMEYISKSMKDAGFHTNIYPYAVYLPEAPGTAFAAIVTPTRVPLNNQEDIIPEDLFSAHPDLHFGWNAYSGSGDVTGQVVYANYGTKEDFEKLEDLGVDLNGKIVIARYGKNFRGYKAKFAEEYGAAALIIYTDPADSGYAKGLVYPEGTYYNHSSVQRGSLKTLDWPGDPLTPGKPAIGAGSEFSGNFVVDRLDPKKIDLPNIPVLPLPYGSANEIFQRMKGSAVPPLWQGGLPCTYRLEGGPELTVRVKVSQDRRLDTIKNVVSYIQGSVYPDDWIILGSHYDAWGFGATDPNSGTALILTIAETLRKLANSGYHPKRSIYLAHWDAEEQGLIGSTEWVEQMKEELMAKSVCYINLDGAVSGPNFGASSAPMLKAIISDVAKKIPYPDNNMSLFYKWKLQSNKEPDPGSLGGGSDHVAFYMFAGVPSISTGMGGPTLYHTNYDNLHYYEKFANPNYVYAETMHKFVTILTLRLANADVIPFEISRYATDLKTHLNTLENELKKAAPSLTNLLQYSQQSLNKLNKVALLCDQKIKKILNTDKLHQKKIDALNQRLKNLEKAFLYEEGMPFASWYKSLYVASDPYTGYSSWILPALKYCVNRADFSELKKWDKITAEAIDKLTEMIKKINKEL